MEIETFSKLGNASLDFLDRAKGHNVESWRVASTMSIFLIFEPLMDVNLKSFLDRLYEKDLSFLILHCIDYKFLWKNNHLKIYFRNKKVILLLAHPNFQSKCNAQNEREKVQMLIAENSVLFRMVAPFTVEPIKVHTLP